MSKFVQAFLSGAFFTFFIDFFLFLGMKLNYIDFYEIDLYYNPFFADNQNIYIYLTFTLLFGFIITYLQSIKIALIVIGSLFVLSLSTFITPIGHAVGKLILQTKNQTFKDSKHIYQGNVIYNGRQTITLYEYELQRVITLKKKDLVNLHI